MGQAFLVSGTCQQHEGVAGGDWGTVPYAGWACVWLPLGAGQACPQWCVPCCRPSQPLLDRSIPDFTAFTSVDDWLSAVKMSQYRDSFLTAGFTSLQLVAQMTSE